VLRPYQCRTRAQRFRRNCFLSTFFPRPAWPYANLDDQRGVTSSPGLPRPPWNKWLQFEQGLVCFGPDLLGSKNRDVLWILDSSVPSIECLAMILIQPPHHPSLAGSGSSGLTAPYSLPWSQKDGHERRQGINAGQSYRCQDDYTSTRRRQPVNVNVT
jgi:hypothetical protein